MRIDTGSPDTKWIEQDFFVIVDLRKSETIKVMMDKKQ